MALKGFDTFKGFEGGYGYRRDPIGADRLYRDAVSAASGSLLKNLDRDLGDIVGDLVKTGRAKPYGVGSRWMGASGVLAGADLPSVAKKRPFGSSALLDHVLTSDPTTNMHKQIAAATANLKSASKGLTGLYLSSSAHSDMAKAGMIPDVAKVGRVPTAMQEAMRAEAEIKGASTTARDQLIAKAGSLSAAFGRYAGTDRLFAAAYGSSGRGQPPRATDVFAKVGLFARPADEQLSGVRALSKASLGLYKIPTHDPSGFGALMKEFTTYGPVVVTPDGPAPARPDYTPSLRTAPIPDTTSPDDVPALEDVWEEVILVAQELARRYRGNVVIRRLGPKGEIILLGLITNAIYDLVYYIVTR